MSRRILVVEDDADTAEYILKGLREAGFTAEHVADGRDGLYMASSSDFDAVVMDRMLPGMDGLSVTKAVRAAGVQTPILILSALAHLDERVTGLRAGADDYLTKPFGFAELAARLENLMRRGGAKPVETSLACGDLTLDLLSRRVTRAGRTLELLPRELKLLEYFLRHRDRVVTRTMLLEEVWDYRFDPHTSLIDTHISRLRKKIDEGFDKPLLHTVRGSGYRLSEAP
ncbi:DNA-binding response regulator [Caulobacter sp. D4A]|uniref:response regulator transcription factor n=1 Tax=unclassified Caulobacter TaxID=2648921 RepID=UPI000D73BE95|nr:MULTISPECIES: response regulator transcription factor [unclassified Caulobacter]PXA92496.1 DNA-binding response regulator [Caulobacter sp. D5]PXA95651.1 DNA-binding response regulator [Caulobacter sp. D4A]